jgi:S-DNA-T family DNA segregation ATPase FtsK/SpoIIIE
MERDELFNECAALVVNSQIGSTSLLQRRLKLGYNRAGRIMEQLHDAKIVGEYDGTKPRVVLIKSIDELNNLLKQTC